jgi:DNA-binding transcriptional regulator LsrR (DeoR family)
MSSFLPPKRGTDLELLGKVARLHYDFGLTHQEIGEILRLSRVKVTRLLQQARDVGVVQIEVRTDASPFAAIEFALTATFDLDEALIVPEFEDRERLRPAIARTAAGYLTRVLHDGMTVALALSRTVALVPSFISTPRPVAASFVSLVGGLRSSSEAMNPYESTERLAQLFGGTAEHLHAPVIVASAEAAQALMQEPMIAQTLQRAREADTALVGLGGVHDHLNLVAEGYMTAEGWEELVAAGMVGDIGARYFDASGQPVDCDVNDRVIGLTLDELRRIPLRVVVAGGRDKDSAIHAALRTGLISVLVTDAGTASRVLEAHRKAEGPRSPKRASRARGAPA